jgi:hypothetical protein
MPLKEKLLAARNLIKDTNRESLPDRRYPPVLTKEKSPAEIARLELKNYLDQDKVKPAAARIEGLLLGLMNASESRPNIPLRVFAVSRSADHEEALPGDDKPIQLIITAATDNDELRRAIMEENVQTTLSAHMKNQQDQRKLRPLEQLPSTALIDTVTPDELAALNGRVVKHTSSDKFVLLSGLPVISSAEHIFNPDRIGDPVLQVFSSLDDPNSERYEEAKRCRDIICIADFSVETIGIYIGSIEDPGADY